MSHDLLDPGQPRNSDLPLVGGRDEHAAGRNKQELTASVHRMRSLLACLLEQKLTLIADQENTHTNRYFDNAIEISA